MIKSDRPRKKSNRVKKGYSSYGLHFKYTLLLKSLGSERFVMFFKEVSSAHHGCLFDQNYRLKVILWNIIAI